MDQNKDHQYKTFEIISTLFAIAFTAGMFIKFMFF
jgi:hypothetical protein